MFKGIELNDFYEQLSETEKKGFMFYLINEQSEYDSSEVKEFLEDPKYKLLMIEMIQESNDISEEVDEKVLTKRQVVDLLYEYDEGFLIDIEINRVKK